MKKLRFWLGILGSALLLGLSSLTVKADSASYNAGTNTVDGSFDGGNLGIWQVTFDTGQVYTSADNLNGEAGFSISVPAGATSATVLMQQIESGAQSSYQVAISQPSPAPQEEPQPAPQEEPQPAPQEEPQTSPAPTPAPDTQQPGTDSGSQTQPDANQSNQSDSDRQQEILDNERKKEEEARQKDRSVSALAGLTVEGGEFSPAFDPAVTEYTVTIGEVDRVRIQAVTAVDGQTVNGDGEIAIDKKDKDVEITVTSADGAQTTKYILHIRIKPVKKEEKNQSQTEKKEKTESQPKKQVTKSNQREDTSAKPQSTEGQTKTSKLLIVGLIIGAVVLIGGGIGGYFFLQKKGFFES